ncbi:lysoplasmalogenase [Kribbella sp. NPDC051770]|uniref:lysoplasmalogenase n=1 Tax=Kribbella sp. NPDC051770 TaxID=3155413 RepID=UPI003436C70F
MRNRWGLVLYAVLSVAHLVAIAIDEKLPRLLTKLALMPTLAVWARLQGAAWLLAGALAASLLGDALLEGDELLLGMAAFGVAHVCYIVLFSQRTTHRSWKAAATYGVLWLAGMVFLWPGLDDQRLPVAVYSLLVTGTALTSMWFDWRTGIGGLVFMVSDGLIGVELAGHDFAGRDYLVMATYCLAQYLLVVGLVPARERVAEAVPAAR